MYKNYLNAWASFQVSRLIVTAFPLVPPIEGISGQIKRQNFGSWLGKRYLKSGMAIIYSLDHARHIYLLILCGFFHDLDFENTRKSVGFIVLQS